MDVLAGVTLTVGVAFVVLELPPPPQPTAAKLTATASNRALSICLQRRDGRGRKKNSRAAIVVPPAAVNHTERLGRLAFATEVEAAVVATVTVPVALAVPELMVTVLPVKVGVLTAPEGDEVTAAVRVTVPV